MKIVSVAFNEEELSWITALLQVISDHWQPSPTWDSLALISEALQERKVTLNPDRVQELHHVVLGVAESINRHRREQKDE